MNLHLAWLPWNCQAKSEILHCRKEVQNGEPFHKFRDEQIAKPLPKNIAKNSNTTRRMRFAMQCRKLLGYNTSLSIMSLPRNKQMKIENFSLWTGSLFNLGKNTDQRPVHRLENLKSIGVNRACFSLFLNQELLWMNYRSIIGFGSRMIRRIMVILESTDNTLFDLHNFIRKVLRFSFPISVFGPNPLARLFEPDLKAAKLLVKSRVSLTFSMQALLSPDNC